ncbi:MAG: 4-hydroxythreonine-4-phosphate dehydrogenase PdxA [Pseudomonadota bacterium]
MAAPIAVTSGDPAGVGPEISVKAWQALKGADPFFVIGDLGQLTGVASRLGARCAAISEPGEAAEAFATALPVLPLPLPKEPHPGSADLDNAAAVIESIDKAVALAQSGAAAGVVTNPISKKVLKDGASFAFPGHTEYLAHLGGVARSVMMLAAPALRVVPVTIHIPLEAVPRALTPDLLEETLRIAHAGLQSDFGLREPRIAVAGLNPHAGEGGAMGDEEQVLIAPVLERLRGDGMHLRGPLSADTMFHPPARATYDLAVCIYHDQALIPIKTLDFENGVNVTLGLPFIRTSPDHGTAFDIAGRGIASPASLIAAIRMAGEMAARRHG